MEVNDRYKAGFLHHLDASQRGDITFIPNPLDRVNEAYNIMQSRYTLLFGATGSGKTSFADFNWILSPWSFMQKHDMDIHWEVLYFSLERKEMFKHAKWVTWLIYRDDTEMLLSADQVLGWKNGPINSAGYKLVRSYDDEMSQILEHVRIFDGKLQAKALERTINTRAFELGTFFSADDVGVRQDDNPIYIEKFDEKGLKKSTKIGEIPFIELEWEGTKFTLEPETHRYFPKHPRTFLFIIVDGINLLGSKEVLDQISLILADSRDKFGFSPVVVSQQNRALGDVTRLKLHGADLSPQIEDVFKSSQMGFDADLILGMFDPHRYKSWDKSGRYGGYQINPMGDIGMQSMLSPKGFSRFRSLHVLKNSFGPDGNIYGLKFLGECNHFMTLPRPDTLELEKVYEDIQKGL